MNVYLLCNAHLDPMWQWEWEEGAASAVSTFRCAADFCEEYDALVFNHNEAILYRWIEEYEPELFERIKKLVALGKWNIMGGWTLQPDCNLPSGESMIGQIKDGNDYFREKFGVSPKVAVNVDSFGHSRGLVQILKKCGYEGYLFMRPQKYLQTLPEKSMMWKGFDGSLIKTHRFDEWYCTPLGKAVDVIEQNIAEGLEENRADILVLWGVGDHGGGPSRIDLDRIAEMKAKYDAEGKVNIIHSGAEEFFKTIDETKIPVFDGHFRHSMQGCYTSQIRVKQAHRKLENKISFIKAISSAANMNNGVKYPFEEIEKAVRDLSFAQFHDLLPGSSIREVEEAGLEVMAHAQRELNIIRARMFFALCSGQKKAKDGDIPVLVFNPHPFPYEADIDCEFMLADQNQNHEIVYVPEVHDENGNIIPSQLIKERSNVDFDWRKRVTFRAKVVPMSVTRFDCTMKAVPVNYGEKDWRGLDWQLDLSEEIKEDIVIKRGNREVVFDKDSGLIKAYIADGKNMLSAPVTIDVFADNQDPWGMDGIKLTDKLGSFSLADPVTAARICGLEGKVCPIHITEQGSVKTTVEAIYTYNSSTAVVTYSLPENGELTVDILLNNAERDVTVKAVFPTAFGNGASLFAEDMFGVSELSKDEGEQPMHRYAGLKEKDDAFVVINDGVYTCDARDNALRITLLRSPAYTAHPTNDKRHIVPYGRFTPRIDIGERQFRFTVCPVKTDKLPEVHKKAAVFNNAPYALSFFPSGLGEKTENIFSISGDVEMTCCEKLRNGNYLIRIFNPSDKVQTADIRIDAFGIAKTVELQPYAADSFIMSDAEATLVPCDMLGNILQ